MAEKSPFVQAEIPCPCGERLLVHWKAQRMAIGDLSVRCPKCNARHMTGGTPLRLFRKVGEEWVKVSDFE